MDSQAILKHLITKNGLCPSGVDIFNKSKTDISMIASAIHKWVELFIEHEDDALKVFDFATKEDMSFLKSQGIFYNEKVNIQDCRFKQIILLGNSFFDIKIQGYEVCKIYALNDSKGKINCKGNSISNIEVYHNSNVHIDNDDNSKTSVYLYNGVVTGNIDVIKKDYQKGEIFNYKN